MFKKKQEAKASAQVKDGALVLYLPQALKPCVWRMDLDILSETSIEIDEKDNIYILATRDINGVIKSIAGFHSLDDAQEALALSLEALMATQPNKAGKSGSSFVRSIPFWPIIKWGFIILLVLWTLATLFLTDYEEGALPPQAQTTGSNNTDASALDETGQIKMGVPIDVDSLYEEAK